MADEVLRRAYALGRDRDMKVLLAKSAGFCYGVKRAVELARADRRRRPAAAGCWAT